MPRGCTICIRTDRSAVDTALLSQETLRTMAQRFGTSPAALFRHRENHLSTQETLPTAEPAQEPNRQVHQPDPPNVTVDHLPLVATKENLVPASTTQPGNTPPLSPCPTCGEKSYRQLSDGRVMCVYCHKLPTY